MDGVTDPVTTVMEQMEIYWRPNENEALSCRGPDRIRT